MKDEYEENFERLNRKETVERFLIEECVSPKQIAKTENEFRKQEYDYFIENNSLKEPDLKYKKLNSEKLENFDIERLYQIKKLRMTSVQTAYSRQEPIDIDLFSQTSDEGDLPNSQLFKAKFTSTKGLSTTYLPAIESYGEGFFMDFDRSFLLDWFTKNWQEGSKFKTRLETLKQNVKNAEYGIKEETKKMCEDNFYLAKYVLLHTLSHLLIKELEFTAGYPATSINERLYVDAQSMQGILIYTVAGAEGSYGGLVAQTEEKKFQRLLQSALFRAKDCASDPICYTSEGQGIGNKNLASCYSCSLLPETSCEAFNSLLDRRLLVDWEFGLFANV